MNDITELLASIKEVEVPKSTGFPLGTPTRHSSPAIILASKPRKYDAGNFVVLCYWAGAEGDRKWIVWYCDDKRNTYHGDYFLNPSDAITHYNQRR